MLRSLLLGNWGSLAIGQRRVPVWLIVMLIGLVVWLGSILLATGADALVAAWSALALLMPIVLLSTLTRTVGLRLVGVFFLLGGAMISVALLWVILFETVHPAHDRLRDTVQPIVEELLKLAPLLVYLWWRRRDRAWALGATDVLLLGAAVGVAFGFVEEAYVRHNPLSLLWRGPAWLPVADSPDYGARLIVGHAVWTTVAAGGIGLALLLRARRPVAVVIAFISVLWPTLDHINTNVISSLGRRASDDAPVRMIQAITGRGWWLAYGMLAVVVVVIVADSLILIRTWPGVFARLRPGVTSPSVLHRWRLTLFARSLAFIRWQFAEASRLARTVPVELAGMSTEISRAFELAEQNNEPQAPLADSAAPAAGEVQP